MIIILSVKPIQGIQEIRMLKDCNVYIALSLLLKESSFKLESVFSTVKGQTDWRTQRLKASDLVDAKSNRELKLLILPMKD
jgi:hypothetical protein